MYDPKDPWCRVNPYSTYSEHLTELDAQGDRMRQSAQESRTRVERTTLRDEPRCYDPGKVSTTRVGQTKRKPQVEHKESWFGAGLMWALALLLWLYVYFAS